MLVITKASFCIVAMCTLSSCYTVGEKTSKSVDAATEAFLPSANWYTKALIAEAAKLSLDPHYYNRLGEALVK